MASFADSATHDDAAANLVQLAGGMPASAPLVGSQMVLGLCVPLAFDLLLCATADRELMGQLVNRRTTTVTGWVCATAIVAVNGWALARPS